MSRPPAADRDAVTAYPAPPGGARDGQDARCRGGQLGSSKVEVFVAVRYDRAGRMLARLGGTAIPDGSPPSGACPVRRTLWPPSAADSSATPLRTASLLASLL